MSDPHIALIAEGPTDFIVIESALKAVLTNNFVLTLLQPESTRPEMGLGWGGVFKWCKEFRERGAISIDDDPILNYFDLVIIHVDADVADKAYGDIGPAMEAAAAMLHPLPCSMECPPPSNTVEALEAVLLSWLGVARTGAKSLFCIPSKASDAWLAAAVLPDAHPLMAGLECNLDLRLANLPMDQRIRKTAREYRSRAEVITSNWARVKLHCSQAELFDDRIHARMP
jgi:hypothetical protein